jgi:hypothetical protein
MVPQLLDISMIHPRCPTYIAAASHARGASAALRDRSKYRTHARHLHRGHTSVPASVETYGHLGKPIMRYLRTLSDVASVHSVAVTPGALLASSHRELSVVLVLIKVMCTALARCCSPRLRGGRFCLGRTFLSLINRYVVLWVPIWL